jgi:hypothetical protein
MIDAVKQQEALSLRDVRDILGKAFDCPIHVYRDRNGHPCIRLKSFRRGSGSTGEFVSEFLRQLAGQCLAAAEELDVAAGFAPELVLEEIPDNRRFFQVAGFEDVDIVVHNCRTSEEAATLARQAVASITAGRQSATRPPRSERVPA